MTDVCCWVCCRDCCDLLENPLEIATPPSVEVLFFLSEFRFWALLCFCFETLDFFFPMATDVEAKIQKCCQLYSSSDQTSKKERLGSLCNASQRQLSLLCLRSGSFVVGFVAMQKARELAALPRLALIGQNGKPSCHRQKCHLHC